MEACGVGLMFGCFFRTFMLKVSSISPFKLRKYKRGKKELFANFLIYFGNLLFVSWS